MKLLIFIIVFLVNASVTCSAKQDSSCYFKFHRCLIDNDLESLKQLYVENPSLANETYEIEGINRDVSALTVAAYLGNQEMVEFLLLVDCKIHDKYGCSCLGYASTVEIAKILIDHGADINEIDKDSLCTPLHLAVSLGHLNVADYFISKGAKVYLKTKAKRNLFHLFSKQFDSNFANFLLTQYISTNAKDTLKYTPLHYAIKYNNIALVDLFLHNSFEVKTDITIKTPSGLSPLLFAAECLNPEIFENLVTVGASVEETDVYGNNAFHIIAKRNSVTFENQEADVKQIFNILLLNKVNINAKNRLGYTPLHLAVIHKNYPAVKQLIQAGANVSIVDDDDENVFALAKQLNLGKKGDLENKTEKSKMYHKKIIDFLTNSHDVNQAK